MEGYGQTENTAVGCLTLPGDTQPGAHVVIVRTGGVRLMLWLLLLLLMMMIGILPAVNAIILDDLALGV